jgi:hypothetical protein
MGNSHEINAMLIPKIRSRATIEEGSHGIKGMDAIRDFILFCSVMGCEIPPLSL